jgi:hypothetical protein
VFEFGIEEDGKYFVQVKEGVSLEANSDVFLVISFFLYFSFFMEQQSCKVRNNANRPNIRRVSSISNFSIKIFRIHFSPAPFLFFCIHGNIFIPKVEKSLWFSVFKFQFPTFGWNRN